MASCKLSVIPASAAPVAAVIRQGPSRRFQVLRWDLDTFELEPGGVLRGKLLVSACNVSPDGKLFGYSAIGVRAPDSPWFEFFAVSKLPWLTALVAWRTCGTYLSRCRFGEDGSVWMRGVIEEEPFHGSYPGKTDVGSPFTSASTPVPVDELEQMWKALPAEEAARVDAPQATKQYRNHPKGSVTPGPAGWRLYRRHAGRKAENYPTEIYALRRPDGSILPLPEFRWADWDAQGRLLSATHEGEIRVHVIQDDRLDPRWSADLDQLESKWVPAPEWARSW